MNENEAGTEIGVKFGTGTSIGIGIEDMSAILPDGKEFAFWETENIFWRELHVDCNSPNASDDNDGSEINPFKTINAAARIARAKTRVLIHSGVYRECVSPEQGGNAPDAMVSYEAFGDGEVIVKASVQVLNESIERSSGWNLRSTDKNVRIWAFELDPDEFRGYNPFCAINMPHDRQYIDFATIDMNACLNRCGMVFVDGKPLKQTTLYSDLGKEDNTYWVETNGQRVHFRLKGDTSHEGKLIEVSCREQCFAPKKPFLGYIRVKGITFAHASMGAPVPQKGAVSCNRGHHWIIEDCVIDWSNAIGIDCGNECWNRSREQGQILGNTVVRRNTIWDAGICGIAAMGSHNMLIEDNLITGAGWQGMELAWESGGIKLYGTIDGLIRRNIIRDCYRCDGLWLDYENRNNRVTGNLFLDGNEIREHIFLECNKDTGNGDSANMVDNNIIWNSRGRYEKGKPAPEIGTEDWDSDIDNCLVNGYGIYMEGNDSALILNNLIGNCAGTGIYAKTMSFRIAGGRGGTNIDNVIYNNIFYDCAEAAIKLPTAHNSVEGNTYVKMRRQGGYLRVLYPAPVMCLDLKAWRRIFGFDLNGEIGKMDITVDSDNLTIEINLRECMALKEFGDDVKTECDFYGNEVTEGRVSGPFADSSLGTGTGKFVFSIDPRKNY